MNLYSTISTFFLFFSIDRKYLKVCKTLNTIAIVFKVSNYGSLKKICVLLLNLEQVYTFLLGKIQFENTQATFEIFEKFRLIQACLIFLKSKAILDILLKISDQFFDLNCFNQKIMFFQSFCYYLDVSRYICLLKSRSFSL